MSLEASTLSIVVKSDGIADNTKALEALARAGDKAEKSTAKLSQSNKGAEASAKQQEKLWYDLIDKASKYYEKQFNVQQKALQRENAAAEAAILREAQAMNRAFDKRIAEEAASYKKLQEQADKYYAQQQRDAEASYKKLQREADRYNTQRIADANAALRRESQQQAEGMARVSAEYHRLTEATNNSRVAMRGHNSEMENAHALVRGLSGSLGALWLTYGNIIPLIAGAAIGASIKEAVSGFIEVQYQMTFMRALTEDTTHSVKELTDSMHKVAGELGINPEAASKGLRALAQAGLDTDQALRTLPDAFKLATVGELPLEAAALAGISVMNAYGQSVDNFSHIGDVMAKAGAMSAASVESMTESFKYSAGTAEQYGVSLEKLAASLTLLGKRSITGSSAGVAVNNLITETYSPSSDKARQAQQALGVKAYVNGVRQNFEDVIQQIKDGLKKFDPESQGILLEAMYGKKGGKAYYAVAQQSKETFLAMEKELVESSGFTADVYRKSLETVRGQLDLTKSAISNLFSTVGEEAENPIKNLLQSVRGFANDPAVKDAFAGFAQSIKTFITTIVPVATVVGGVWAAMKTGTVVIATLQAAFARMAAVSLVDFFAKALASLTLFVEGVVTMNATMLLTNPIFIALTGLVTVAAGAYLLLHKNQSSVLELHDQEMKNSREVQDNLSKEIDLLQKKIDLQGKGIQAGDMESEVRKMNYQSVADQAKAELAQYEADKALAEKGKAAVGAPSYAVATNNAKILQEIEKRKKIISEQEANIKKETEQQEKLHNLRRQYDINNYNQENEASYLPKLFPEYQSGDQKFDPKGDRDANKKLNAYKQEMLELQKLGASYDAKTQAMLEFYRTGSKVAADSQQAIVEVNRLSGKYASDDMYLKALGQAKIVDEAKFRNEKTKTFVELTGNMEKIIDGESAFQKAAKDSGTMKLGYYARQVEAAKEMLGWSDKEIAKAREMAAATDEVKRAEEARQKLTSAADSARSRAGEAQAEIDSMEQFGAKTKVTAIEVAKLAIEKARLSSAGDQLVKSNLLEAATMEQLKNGYRDLLKQNVDLDKELQETQADGVGVFADSEQAKIKIAADAAKKRAAIEIDAVRKAADQESMNGGVSRDTFETLEKAYSTYQDNIAKIDQISDQKTNNVKLKDWKKTVDDIENIAREGFFNLSQKGVSLWSSMLTTFKSMFKTTVMDYIYKQFAKPFVMNVIASVSGSLGMTGLANAASSMTGAVSSGGSFSALSTAKSIYDAVTGGFSSLSSSVADAVQAGLYKTGLSSNIASNGAFATTAGNLATGAAGALAGYGVGNAIAGNYSAAGGSAVTAIASAVGSYILPGIGGLIGGAIGGLYNRAFGMGDKNVTATGIKGTISDYGVSGVNYSDWKQKGGWFRSDKSGTDTKALSADIINSFKSGLDSLKAQSSAFADNLGVSADALQNYSKAFNIALTSDAQANQEAITKFFTEMGDDIATKLVPNISQFAKSGETASVTLQRLSETFAATKTVADILGKSVSQLFGADGLASAAARTKLVDMSGGSDALTSKTAAYVSAIYTDAEKLAPVQKALAEEMNRLGLASVKTKAQFKSVVDGLDLTKDSDIKLFNSLLDLSSSFATVADAAETANQSIVDGLSNTMEKLKSFSNSIKTFRDGLVLGNLSTLTPEQKLAAAASQYQNTLQKAMSGDENAQGKLTDIAQSYLEQARSNFASSDAYTAIFDKVQTDLSGVSDWADKQISDAQQQINQLQGLNNTSLDILGALNGISNTLGGYAPATAIVPNEQAAATVTSTAISFLKTAIEELKQTVAQTGNNTVGAIYDSSAKSADQISDTVTDTAAMNKPTMTPVMAR